MEIAIQPLPIDVINLIAAGEVIDSLAAVVRELVENAIDAAATRITIVISPQQWRIAVTDNGSGISFDNLQQVAAPHTTSKIHDRADLLAVSSLGFRGEALHSMAQLGQLTVLSCPSVDDTGWHIRYNIEGTVISADAVAMAPGTTVIVENLFGRWLARRQIVPTIAQQLKTIQSLLQTMAIAHPQITWRVHLDESRSEAWQSLPLPHQASSQTSSPSPRQKPWLQILPGKTARQILPQLIRDIQPSDLLELTQYWPEGKLYLLLGKPDRCHRHRPDWIKIAVNGRVVRLPELEQLMIQQMRRMVPRDRFPVSVLHLTVPPAMVDWNRHPAKAELYLQHLEEWKQYLIDAIVQILQLTPETIADAGHNARVQNLLKVAEETAGYNANRTIGTHHPTTPPAPHALLPLKAIGQVHKMYIMAEHPAGLWLIEQHIAHERVLYEQICDRWEILPLATPLLLDNLTTVQVAQLERIGLDVTAFGDTVWAVRSLPQRLMEHPEREAAVRELSLGGDLPTAQVAIACRTAIRNGTELSIGAMQTLLDQWQQCRNPHTCPHGRPIYMSLQESSLARFFRRHWVVGKSHGI
jgi:DNA mismatch repair protein MutL